MLKAAKNKLGRVIMDSADPIERLTRRLLKLPAEAPDPSGFSFEPLPEDHPRYGQLYKMVEVPESETEAALAQWHREGARARLADGVKRRVHTVGYNIQRGLYLQKVTWPVRQKLFWHELANARQITWVAWHYAAEGESTHIDGYLKLPSGREMGFDISCIGDDEHWAQEAWSYGESYSDHTEIWGCPSAVLPTEVLTPALLEIALRGWYVKRFGDKQGHWINLERRLPDFTIDAYWEEADECEKMCRKSESVRRQAAADAHALMHRLLSSETSLKLYQSYNADAVPASLTEQPQKPAPLVP